MNGESRIWVVVGDTLRAHNLTWEDIKENIPPFITVRSLHGS